MEMALALGTGEKSEEFKDHDRKSLNCLEKYLLPFSRNVGANDSG